MRRAGAAAPRKAMSLASLAKKRAITTRDVQALVNGEPWEYFDTRILSAYTVPPASGAYNFAQWSNPEPFFSERTKGNSDVAICNAGDKGKFEYDFLCESIAVDVNPDASIPRGTDLPTAREFAECIVNYGVLMLSFGSEVKWMSPVMRLPSGGGLVVGQTIHTAAAADDVDTSSVNNGLQTAQARRKLPEPIFFEKGQPFELGLYVDGKGSAANTTYDRIKGLTALSGMSKVAIRVGLIGKRGRQLLVGTPPNA